jgi:molybdate transport system substrate-binding protein
MFRAGIVIGLIIAALAPARAQDSAKTITVFAAASLKNAIDDINFGFTRATGIKAVASYAASPALAQQLVQGAPADVFISADAEWMDHAAQNKALKPGTRFDLLGNRLALIAPKDSKLTEQSIGPGFELAKLAGDGRVVIADARAVPAGKYAKAALEKFGAWKAVEGKLAMVENVRAALALVARGEAPIGIVYETDAKAEPNVKVVGRFPEDSHPRIVYPAALTATAKPEAARYLAFLRSATGQVVFQHHGFTYLVKAGP